jgi:hypothetical protein
VAMQGKCKDSYGNPIRLLNGSKLAVDMFVSAMIIRILCLSLLSLPLH